MCVCATQWVHREQRGGAGWWRSTSCGARWRLSTPSTSSLSSGPARTHGSGGGAFPECARVLGQGLPFALCGSRSALHALADEHWAIAAPLLVVCGGCTCFAGFRFYENLRRPLLFSALFLALALAAQLDAIPIRLVATGNGLGDEAGASTEAGTSFSPEDGWVVLALLGSNATIACHTMDLVKSAAVLGVSAAISRSALHIERCVIAMISGVCGANLGALTFIFLHICATRARGLFCGIVDSDPPIPRRSGYDALHSALLAVLGGVLGTALAVPRALVYYRSLGRALSGVVGALMFMCGILILVFRGGIALGADATQMCSLAGGQGKGAESDNVWSRLVFWSRPHLLAGVSTVLTIATPGLAFWGFLHQTQAAEAQRRAEAVKRSDSPAERAKEYAFVGENDYGVRMNLDGAMSWNSGHARTSADISVERCAYSGEDLALGRRKLPPEDSSGWGTTWDHRRQQNSR